MINESEENVKEVSTQKNQIETMLLHMTDGILAFDMNNFAFAFFNMISSRIIIYIFQKMDEQCSPLHLIFKKIYWLEKNCSLARRTKEIFPQACVCTLRLSQGISSENDIKDNDRKIIIGDLQLDLDKFEVKVRGKTLRRNRLSSNNAKGQLFSNLRL